MRNLVLMTLPFLFFTQMPNSWAQGSLSAPATSIPIATPDDCLAYATKKTQQLYFEKKASPSVVGDRERWELAKNLSEKLQDDPEVLGAVKEWSAQQSAIDQKFEEKVKNLGALSDQERFQAELALFGQPDPAREDRDHQLREKTEPSINIIAEKLRKAIPLKYKRQFLTGKLEEIDVNKVYGTTYYRLSYDQGSREKLVVMAFLDGPQGQQNLFLNVCEQVYLKNLDPSQHCFVLDTKNEFAKDQPLRTGHVGFENFLEFMWVNGTKLAKKGENNEKAEACLRQFIPPPPPYIPKRRRVIKSQS